MKNFKTMVNNVKTKIVNFANKTISRVVEVAQVAKCRLFGTFAQNNGEGFVDTALKILISVVVGALLLAGLYMLFQDTILPELSKRITELFDYKG